MVYCHFSIVHKEHGLAAHPLQGLGEEGEGVLALHTPKQGVVVSR